MALTLGDNFSYQGAKPLDARLKYETVAAMKAVADATMYDGCLAYCAGTDKTYQWKSGNTVDETTGKWREFNSGGGGGGGTTYEAGDGIDITNDVISTKKSASGDIDKIIDRYPTGGELVSIVNAFNKGDLYSADEKMIGQWIDGKPLYQKTVDCGALPNAGQLSVSHNIANIDIIPNFWGIGINQGGRSLKIPGEVTGSNHASAVGCYVDRTEIGFLTYNDRSGYHAYVTIQYTKTTDSAIAIGSENEYSTSEKIVGTWIDGSPVCQAVVQFTPIVANGNTWYETDADVSGFHIGFMILSPVMSVKGSYPAICEIHTNGKLRFMQFRGSDSPTIKGAVLQYVKSTT